MGGLFGGGASPPPPPPPPPPPAPMPVPSDPQVQAAQTKQVAAAEERSGRLSTILSDNETDKLGG